MMRKASIYFCIIKSEFVVSAGDLKNTAENLLRKFTSSSIHKQIERLQPSLSTFGIYIGLKDRILEMRDKAAPIWIFTNYNFDKAYNELYSGNGRLVYNEGILINSPSSYNETLAPIGQTSMIILAGARYATKDIWDAKRQIVCNQLLETAGKYFRGLNSAIDFLETATPITFEKYTLNYKGAMCGWASIPTQIDKDIVEQKSDIERLYLCGHWVTMGFGQGGVSTAAYSGKIAAKLILKDWGK